MASFEIRWRTSTKKDLRRIPQEDIIRILAAVAQLGQEPLPHGSEKLAGSDYTYRIRIGDYRVVYELLHRGGIVEIQRVRHQGCLSLTLHHRTNGNLIIFTDGSIVETNDVLPK